MDTLDLGMVRTLLDCNATVIVAGRSRDKFQKAFSEQEQKRLTFITIDITKSEIINSFLPVLLMNLEGLIYW